MWTKCFLPAEEKEEDGRRRRKKKKRSRSRRRLKKENKDKQRKKEGRTSVIQTQICIGVAEGEKTLHTYLHSHSSHSSSILLHS
jgi:hypothetical protein